MRNCWWDNIVLSLLGQSGSVGSSVFLDESQFGGVLCRVTSNVGQYGCVFRRVLGGIGFQGGVRFFSLISGRVRGDILGCVFHDGSISFGSNVGLNCSNFTDGLVLSSISTMVC